MLVSAACSLLVGEVLLRGVSGRTATCLTRSRARCKPLIFLHVMAPEYLFSVKQRTLKDWFPLTKIYRAKRASGLGIDVFFPEVEPPAPVLTANRVGGSVPAAAQFHFPLAPLACAVLFFARASRLQRWAQQRNSLRRKPYFPSQMLRLSSLRAGGVWSIVQRAWSHARSLWQRKPGKGY